MERNIAKVVEVLSSLPYVEIYDSGIGKEQRKRETGYIYLYYNPPKRNWAIVSQFATKLAEIITRCSAFDVDTTLEFTTDSEEPVIIIFVDPQAISDVAKALDDHKNEFSYDSVCTELRNLIM
jgi:hypothetical protein